MKNKLFLAMSLVFGMAILPAKAQVKIGFINADYILSQMPEAKQVEEDLKNTQKQYETLYQGKVKDFQDKFAVYEKLSADPKTADIIKQDKEKELQNLQTSIQEFQQNSQSSLQKKQAQLLQPLLKKVEENMHAVAAENAYTYVFNYDAGMDAHGNPDVGLLWTAYMADMNQYISVQRRLADFDLLNMWTTPIGSSAWAIPGGVAEGATLAEGLFS